MPAMLWIAFWSLMMGSTACLGETPQPMRTLAPPAAKAPKTRDLSSDD